MSYEQFVEKLSLKCAQQASKVYTSYYEILQNSLNGIKYLVQELSTYSDKDCIKSAKTQLSYTISSGDITQSCDSYFKSLSIYKKLIEFYTQRNLLLSQVKSKD